MASNKQRREIIFKNFDAWLQVAKHVPPDPCRFLKLALVNRTFYRIFMSNLLWKPMNIYGIEGQVSLQYLSCARKWPAALKMWLDSSQMDMRHVHACPSSNFLQFFSQPVACSRCGNSTISIDKLPYLGLQLLLSFSPNKFREPPRMFEVDRFALVRDFGCLHFATEDEKSDFDLVLKAVEYNGKQLRLASEELRNDPQIVLAAIAENLNVLEFASDAVRDSFPYEFIMALERGPVSGSLESIMAIGGI